MEGEDFSINTEGSGKSTDIVYNPGKDFYKGIGGELRLKAEGLFKKAKEKGISIEEISITTLKENKAEFPGVGITELPTFIVRIKGRHVPSGQVIVDAKQIDYFNRYQKYIADRIQDKNSQKDERGRTIRENGRPKVKKDPELFLSEWEMFEIGKSLIDDKEFGMEKTITGACDRAIRKLMGENDWLYPEEARLLDEEYNNLQIRLESGKENKSRTSVPGARKATERQVNYLKAKMKNMGLDPDNDFTIKLLLKLAGCESDDINSLNTSEMSRIIDNAGSILTKVREELSKNNERMELTKVEATNPEGLKQ